jgi:hypothetical protein
MNKDKENINNYSINAKSIFKQMKNIKVFKVNNNSIIILEYAKWNEYRKKFH